VPALKLDQGALAFWAVDVEHEDPRPGPGRDGDVRIRRAAPPSSDQRRVSGRALRPAVEQWQLLSGSTRMHAPAERGVSERRLGVRAQNGSSRVGLEPGGELVNMLLARISAVVTIDRGPAVVMPIVCGPDDHFDWLVRAASRCPRP
jgi:hypothetical protein